MFHEAANVDLFKERVKEFVTLVDSNGNEPQPSIDSEIEKRDVLIRKVNNTNDLRKIDDSIRKTIMVKLNR